MSKRSQKSPKKSDSSRSHSHKREGRSTSREGSSMSKEGRSTSKETGTDQEEKKKEEDEEKRKEEEEHHKEKVRYAAENLINLIIPISICMLIVVSVEIFVKVQLQEPIKKFLIAPYTNTENAGQVVINVLCILAFIIVMTVAIVLCVKYNLMWLFFGMIAVTLFLVCFFLTFLMAADVMRSLDIVCDWISFLLFIYNWGVIGMLSFFCTFPAVLKQTFTVVMCCIIAIMYIDHFDLPTVLALLAILVLWDIFAVLTPCGPLNILVKLLKEKGDIKTNIPPGLVYSTMAFLMVKKESAREPKENAEEPKKSAKETKETAKEDKGKEEEEEDDDDHGVHLGLGDFIFYSLLIGKAADYRFAPGGGDIDWNTIIACYIVVLIGLIATVLILLVFAHALPALPISLTLGLIFYFTTFYVITEFTHELIFQLTFI